MKVEYDDALNEAAWKFVGLWDEVKYGRMNGHLFNDVKSILKECIEAYLTEKEDDNSSVG